MRRGRRDRGGGLVVAAAVVVALVAGCSTSRSSVVTPAAPSPAPVDADAPAPASGQASRSGSAAAPSPLVVEGEGELVPGRGPVRLTVAEDGVVRAGDARGAVEVPDAAPAWRARQASIEVVVVDRARDLRGVLVLLPTADVKDPPNRAQLLLLDANGDGDGPRLVPALDLVVGIYGVGAATLEFPGDGSARLVEDGWMACAREDHPKAPVVREVVVYRPVDGGRMAEVERRPTELTQRCADLPSCPIDVVEGDAGR
ncbi:MAG: hypothetical protein R3A79_02010 [Nannocystaceae bacterium]